MHISYVRSNKFKAEQQIKEDNTLCFYSGDIIVNDSASVYLGDCGCCMEPSRSGQ